MKEGGTKGRENEESVCYAMKAKRKRGECEDWEEGATLCALGSNAAGWCETVAFSARTNGISMGDGQT